MKSLNISLYLLIDSVGVCCVQTTLFCFFPIFPSADQLHRNFQENCLIFFRFSNLSMFFIWNVLTMNYFLEMLPSMVLLFVLLHEFSNVVNGHEWWSVDHKKKFSPHKWGSSLAAWEVELTRSRCRKTLERVLHLSPPAATRCEQKSFQVWLLTPSLSMREDWSMLFWCLKAEKGGFTPALQHLTIHRRSGFSRLRSRWS